MRRFDCVIFDLDGTLLYTLEDIKDSANCILERHGFPKRTSQEVKSFVGNGLARSFELCLPHGAQTENFDALVREFKEYYAKHSDIKTKPYDGVPQMLKQLKTNGVRLAIVTNKANAAAQGLHERYFKDCVDITIGEGAGIKRKPDPCGVYAALERLNAEKKRTVYVGDSEVDMETARNSGLECILVSWGFRERRLLTELAPLYVADSPLDITRFVLKGQ